MRKQVWVLGICIAILLVLLFPKTDYSEDQYTVKACNCFGYSLNKCIGFITDCTTYAKPEKDSTEKNKGADITLVFDKSKSMEDEPLREATKAAEDLINIMSEKDTMSVMEFDKEATIIQDFTNSKSDLKKSLSLITTGEDTFYIPAIYRMENNYKQNSKGKLKKVVFLSDGEPSPKESLSDIYKEVYDVAASGICFYTIGYGGTVDEGSRAEQILKSMADISYEQAGCGGYYRSSQNVGALSDILGHIYTDLLNQDLKIILDKPIEPVHYSTDILFNLSTNIHSVCSYELNHGSSQLIFNNTFFLKARPGRNTLRVICRKSIGEEQTKSITREFFVKVNTIEQLKQSKIKTNKIKPLKDEEIEFLLDDIIDRQKLNIVRRMSPQYGGTLVYVLIENTKPVTIKNVQIKQVIPAQITSYPDDLSSTRKYQFTSIDPIEMEFTFAEIQPDEIISFTYYINKKLDSSDLSKIRTIVKFDDVTRADIKQIIAQQNKTRNFLDITSGYENTDTGARGTINLRPRAEVQDLKVYLNIPKCMAYNINKIYFKNTNYRVISDDPLILWQLNELEDDYEFEYELEQKLEEECEKKLSIIAVGNPMAQEEIKSDEAHNILIFLFPLVLLPLVIIIVINKRSIAHEATHERVRLVRTGLLVVFIIFVIIFAYPKDRFKEDKLCDCFGVANKHKCFGLGYSCVVPRAYVEVKESKAPTCPAASCSDLRQYLNVDPYSRAINGVDLILLLDHSKSMEDGKLEQAKAALTNLISKTEDHTRVSLMRFDNTADVIQDFTANRSAAIQSLKQINLGLSTKYIPALTTAHQNFLSKGERRNEWQVIFVSDGAPGDTNVSIFNKVREMTEDEICINTIGFGEEIPNSEAETILKEMARISRDATGCGSYLYSKIDIETLSNVLGKMYEESQIRRLGLDIDMQVSSLRFSSIEEFFLEVRLYSQINGQSVPGEYQIGNNLYCAPLADLTLVLENETATLNYSNVKYDPKLRKYVLGATGVPPGKYTARLLADLNAGVEECQISDSIYVGDIEVFEFDEFDSCKTDDCYEINSYLFSNHTEKKLFVYITDYAFVPQNISISAGTKVVWKNIGQKPHTVTSGINEYDGLFHSGMLYPGDTYNYTFETGEYHEYFDNMSKSLRGDMNVNRTRNYSIGNFSLEYRNNIDLSILIDHSGSMSGSKLENVKLAAEKLVYIIYPGDRVSIVRFSDDADIVNAFTDNRPVLINNIQKMHAGGKTLFIPAFEKALEHYSMDGRENSGRVIIFLSDGEPWDEEGEYGIYNAASKLIDQGICIYAIGYGAEVFPGSKSEAILHKIVELSHESTSCGHYKYSPSDQLRLTKIFGAIYHEAIGEMDGLRLDSTISKKAFLDNESITVNTKVSSSFNNNLLPGFMNETGFRLCGPEARVTAKIKSHNGKEVKDIFLKYIGESGYYANIHDLNPGKYMLIIKAESTNSIGETCNYIGTDHFEFSVLSSQKYVIDPMFLAFFVSVIVMLFFAFWKKKAL